jgi:hypothetical protein
MLFLGSNKNRFRTVRPCGCDARARQREYQNNGGAADDVLVECSGLRSSSKRAVFDWAKHEDGLFRSKSCGGCAVGICAVES